MIRSAVNPSSEKIRATSSASIPAAGVLNVRPGKKSARKEGEREKRGGGGERREKYKTGTHIESRINPVKET